MFTGIIENIGKIIVIEEINNNYVIKIEIADMSINISNGDSIAVNGACLTVVNVKSNVFSFNLLNCFIFLKVYKIKADNFV